MIHMKKIIIIKSLNLLPQFTLSDVPDCFTKAQTVMPAPHASFLGIHTPSFKTPYTGLISNILEGKDLLSHAYVFPAFEIMSEQPRYECNFLLCHSAVLQ